jgi:hypothetical protein
MTPTLPLNRTACKLRLQAVRPSASAGQLRGTLGARVVSLYSFVIGCIWVAALASEAIHFFELTPLRPCKPEYPLYFALVGMALPFFVFGIAAFRAPHSPLYAQNLAAFVDRRLGIGFLESFLIRLRPLLLFGVGGMLSGLHQVLACNQAGVPISFQSRDWFFVSGGAALILSHVILRLRRAKAV